MNLIRSTGFAIASFCVISGIFACKSDQFFDSKSESSNLLESAVDGSLFVDTYWGLE